MDRIASGLQLAEAPVAAPDGGVYFSDVLGGGVHHWSPSTGDVTTVIPKRRGVGGMVPHAEGGLVVTGRNVVHVRDGDSRVVYEDDAAAGFNDMCADPDGNVVVGVLRFRPFTGEEVVPGEFVVAGGGGVVIDGVLWVNGCAFSPDGSTFYGIDYQRGVVLAATRHDDGTYGPSRVVVTSPSGQADGMAIDASGALWVALGNAAAVARFTPDGVLDRELAVPSEFVSSLCFGRGELFITTSTDVWRTPIDVEGAPITPVAV